MPSGHPRVPIQLWQPSGPSCHQEIRDRTAEPLHAAPRSPEAPPRSSPGGPGSGSPSCRRHPRCGLRVRIQGSPPPISPETPPCAPGRRKAAAAGTSAPTPPHAGRGQLDSRPARRPLGGEPAGRSTRPQPLSHLRACPAPRAPQEVLASEEGRKLPEEGEEAREEVREDAAGSWGSCHVTPLPWGPAWPGGSRPEEGAPPGLCPLGAGRSSTWRRQREETVTKGGTADRDLEPHPADPPTSFRGGEVAPQPRTEMQRQPSGEPAPAREELWAEELERLCASRSPVRELPYSMEDRRLIRRLREPEGVKTSCWQRWRRRRLVAGRRLREAAQRLARGFGLWEEALYEIGGLFGTGIQSYFTFLRFLLLLNLLTLLLIGSFVLLPLLWLRPPGPGPAFNFTLQCPSSHQSQPGSPTFHNQLWNVLTGKAFNNTYLFYGAYRAGPESISAYSIRLAYLLSPLACLLLCFCGILQRMVKGLPQKLFLGQDYRSPLSAKIFSSWDFCIRGREATTIKKHEISNEFKVALEEARCSLLVQQLSGAQKARHLFSYLWVNIFIGLLVAAAITAIFWATKYSQDYKEESLFVLLQYLPPGVIALVNFLGPLLFVFLVQLGNYPPNTEVNLSLLWCVVLKLASLGIFSFSLGQTMLCIGRNKTSCEFYGYDVCDYQCWENSVGEELYKLSTFNFLLTVAFTFLVSLPRRLLVERFSGRFWVWLDREEFLVPTNVLDIVAGQTVTWMGLFYCPLLPLFNSVFIFLTFYLKKYTLLRNSRASARRFRASSSTFFFQLVLLLGLLLAAVPLGYVVSRIHSSWDCGLFTNYSAPWQVVPELVALRLPPTGQRILHYLGSHAFSFPLLILLSLVLTVCVSQSQANTRAIQGLRKQLLWQVQEKWHLVEDLSRLLPEPFAGGSIGSESPRSRASRPRSFCPGFPCPGSPGPRPPRPPHSLTEPPELYSPSLGQRETPGPTCRFRFPSESEP